MCIRDSTHIHRSILAIQSERQTDRETGKQTGQIFNYCIFDDTINVSLYFEIENKNKLERLLTAAMLYLIRCTWTSKDGTKQNFLKTSDFPMLSLWWKRNADANAFVSLCTRHSPRWKFGVPPVSKATHQTILGLLTPSLPWHHLKTSNKTAIFETLNCFCLIFHTVVWKAFHGDTYHWK